MCRFVYKSYFTVTELLVHHVFWISVVVEGFTSDVTVLCDWFWLFLCVSVLTVLRLRRMKKVWVRSCRRWASRAVRTSPSKTSGNWSTNRPFRCSAPCTKRRTSTAPASCSKNTWATKTPGPEPGQTRTETKKSFTELFKLQSSIIYVRRTKDDLKTKKFFWNHQIQLRVKT